MKLKNIIFLLLYCVPFLSFSQYKRFGLSSSISALRGKNNYFLTQGYAYRSYLSYDISFQYNFKKLISLNTGVFFENKKNDDYQTYSYFNDSLGYTSYYRVFSLFTYNHVTIPISIQLTFGEKFFIGPNFGFQYSQLLSPVKVNEKYYKTDTYYYDEYYANENKEIEVNNFRRIYPQVGFLVGYSLNNRININLNVKSIINIYSYSNYDVYQGARFYLGMMYKFNSKKNANFIFSSYKLVKYKDSN